MAQDLLRLARTYLGVQQYDARHQQLIQDYNRVLPRPVGYAMKTSDDWCAAFVTVMGDKLPTKGLIPRECGVQRQIHLCKHQGIWLGRVRPEPGDIIFWDWQQNGWADHVGFVEQIDAQGMVTTIEGNTRRQVGRNRYHYQAPTIVGYARPKYSKVLVKSAPKDLDSVAKAVMAGEYGNGTERTKRLSEAGFDPAVVQQRGNEQVQRLKQNETPAPLYDSRLGEIAREVIAGKWGNGADRIKRLTSAGHDPATIQREVNRITQQTANDTTFNQLIQEVLQGKWGNGATRKRRLQQAGHDPAQVQRAVNEQLGKAIPAPTTPRASITLHQGLHYQGRALSGRLIDVIVEEAKQYEINPAFLIVMLDYEGLWGYSQVAQKNNNWAGITWSVSYIGKHDIEKFKGTPRPASEGGHYVHYKSVEDFIRDWIYLLRPGHFYQVSGKTTLSEFVKGLFKVGGAKYDYAAIGYPHYLNGMVQRYTAMIQVNGKLVK